MLTWRAIYRDKKYLPQYNDDGTENGYKDIDRYRLVRFDLLAGEEPIYSVYLNKDQRLIFRRRNFIKLGPQGEERHIIYLVGWQMTLKTNQGYRNITALNYLYEDGSIALDDERNNLELVDQEKTL